MRLCKKRERVSGWVSTGLRMKPGITRLGWCRCLGYQGIVVDLTPQTLQFDRAGAEVRGLNVDLMSMSGYDIEESFISGFTGLDVLSL